MKRTAISVLIVIAGYAFFVKAQGNFHVITPGVAYRSAQLNGGKLVRYLENYKIRSVLNLRGRHAGESWYEDELAVCDKLNVRHYDIALSASHELTAAQAAQVLDVFKNAPRPVLIHCQAGADRSGVVAAMWKVVVDKAPKSEAAKQLTVWYGHFPFGGKRAMDRFFERWAADGNARI